MPTPPITFSEEYRTILNKSKYNLHVNKIIEEFGDLIARNETPFFRQYTDHGSRHIEGVLETAYLLMTKHSQDIISAEDFSLLVMATILHDAALHINERGFIALVTNSQTPSLHDLDTESWKALWNNYVSEVSRFSQSQLLNTFGTSYPIESPDLDKPEAWTQLQFSYIGEFLRRYHHRLAHEMALSGLPGIEETFPSQDLIKSPDSDMDLAGLIARSHGMPLRPLFPYLEANYHIRQSGLVHPIYLMVVLRIADYMQLQSDRAPESVFRIKKIKSPQSRREWNVHHAIKDILYNQHSDPEVVEIRVDHHKTTIDVFLRIQEWLNGIQQELDTSWAILGETYGRYPKQKDLGLTIRRIRSNIDDSQAFGKKAGFVPKRVTFSAADAELLKLLIRPLYGDCPEIAVRELVQNAVDAVQERRVVEKESNQIVSADVDVQIKKHSNGTWSLIVEDHGIGMTFDTLSNFFLNAGASFRSSMAWKKQFQTENEESIVLRSGRFGVGALAAFLIAHDPQMISLKVSTRHLFSDQNDGYEFEAELTDSPLTIRHITKETPGTRIEVTTSAPPAFMQNSSSDKDNLANGWDWFCLDTPRVRRVTSSGSELPQKVTLPANVETSDPEYHWIFPDGYQRVGWSYVAHPSLVCNGIIVAKNHKNFPDLEQAEFYKNTIHVRLPSLSVFDRNGNLPLTLDRLRVDFEQISFLPKLREDVYRNIAAYLLVCAPCDMRNSRDFDVTIIDSLRTHPAISESVGTIPWVLTPEGVSVFDPSLIPSYDVEHFVEVQKTSDIRLVLSVAKHNNFAIVITNKSYWGALTSQHSKSIITGAKRGTYRDRHFIDQFDESRLERALDFHASPHKYKLDNDRIDYKVERDNSVKIENNIRLNLSRKSGGFFNTNSLSEAEIDMYIQKIYSEAEHIHNSTWRYDSQELDSLLSVFLNTFRRVIKRNKTITASLNDAILLFMSISTLPDEYLITEKLEQAIEKLKKPNKKQRQLTYREAKYKFDNLRHALRIDHRLVDKGITVLHYYISGNAGGRYLPNDAVNLLETLNSISPKQERALTTEGEISNSVLDWEALGKKQNLDYETSITEYQVDSNNKVNPSGFLAKVWLTHIPSVIIPYEFEARKEKMTEVWDREEMKRHLRHWEHALSDVKAKTATKVEGLLGIAANFP